MWGNVQGWIFAAVVAVVMGGMMSWVTIPPGMTAPTGTLTLAMKAADLETDPGFVLNAPNSDCDAGVVYASAARHWIDQKGKFESLKSGDIRDADKNVPEPLTEIISATDCGRMTLFANNLDQVIDYHNEHPTLDSLASAGVLLNSLAQLHALKGYEDPKLAARYATAAFNLGRHLYQERIIYAEWMDGLTLMQSASMVLGEIETDPARAQTFNDFASSVDKFAKGDATRLGQIIGGIGEEDKVKYAGDIFLIARDSPEHMWRVEATLKLGRFKFNAPTRGDQAAAKRILKQMAAAPMLSPDPLTQWSVHTAALAGADLTIEYYRLIN
jgi:hypothetical protein